jgi:cytochrome c553
MKKPAYLGLFLMAAAMMVLLSAGQSQAVSTKCWNCHTMHNSQDDKQVAQDRWGEGGVLIGAQPALLKSSCAGCHTSTGSNGIYNSEIPIVFCTGGYPTGTELAGGNFYYAYAGTDTDIAKAHNCVGVTSTTDIAPPGFVSSTSDLSRRVPVNYLIGDAGRPTAWGPATEWTTGTQVTCAGTYGCHGDRRPGNTEPLTALKGAHHGNAPMDDPQVCDGDTLGTSYRFLAGIKGVEQNDGNSGSWEYTPSEVNHNAYFGVIRSGTDPDITASISFLCAECHGEFHNSGAAGIGGPSPPSPWLRHPTDIAMPLTKPGGDDSEFAAYTAYDPVVPIGYVAPTAASVLDPVVPAGSAIVLCVSCHRAHGSSDKDLVRWVYATGGGLPDLPVPSCGTCHTQKVGAAPPPTP